MTIRIAICGDKPIGYVVDGYYIALKYVRRLFRSTLVTSEYIFGVELNGELVSNNGVYPSVFSRFNFNFGDVITYNFIFKPLDSSNYHHSYSIRDVEGTEIGIITTVSDLYTSYSLSIVYLEVVNKRRGLGRAIVDQLRQYGVSLSGFAIVSARGFWEHIGAIFSNSDRFEL